MTKAAPLTLLLLLVCSIANAQTFYALPPASPDGIVHLQAGSYKLDAPIRLTSGTHLRGAGYSKTFVAIIAVQERDALVNLMGANGCTIEGLSFCVRPGPAPSCVLLTGRLQSAVSAGRHNFRRLRIEGKRGVSLATVVEVASESNVHDQCSYSTLIPGGSAVWITNTPPPQLAERYPELAGGSNIMHEFRSCTFGCYGFTGTEVGVRLEGKTRLVRFVGCCFSLGTQDNTRPDRGAFAGIVLDATSQVGGVKVDSCLFDHGGARHCIWTAGRIEGLRITNNYLYALEDVLRITNYPVRELVIGGNPAWWGGMARYDWGNRTAVLAVEGDDDGTN